MSRYRKSGAPAKEVIIPTGSTCGAITVRAIRSDARSSSEPKSAE